jgi:hypothetical protein
VEGDLKQDRRRLDKGSGRDECDQVVGMRAGRVTCGGWIVGRGGSGSQCCRCIMQKRQRNS